MARLTRFALKSAALPESCSNNEPEGEVSSRPPASFSGKLDLSSFAHNGGSQDASAASLARHGATNRSLKRGRSTTITTTRSSTPTTDAPDQSSSAVKKMTTSHPSPSKRRKNTPKSSTSPTRYSHLPLLPDAMGPNLIVMLVGLNPGLQTSLSGHAYAHPSNLFWKLLYSSGLTSVPCKPTEDQTLPARFALGLTNIVARPSRSGAELTKQEMDDGVALLHRKAARARAEAVCIVGKSIWESVWRVRHGRAIRKDEFKYGWQHDSERMGLGLDGEEDVVPLGEEKVPREQRSTYEGARVFVATSTSGLAASLSMAEKERIWRELGSWAERKREERAMEVVE